MVIQIPFKLNHKNKKTLTIQEDSKFQPGTCKTKLKSLNFYFKCTLSRYLHNTLSLIIMFLQWLEKVRPNLVPFLITHCNSALLTTSLLHRAVDTWTVYTTDYLLCKSNPKSNRGKHGIRVQSNLSPKLTNSSAEGFPNQQYLCSNMNNLYILFLRPNKTL